MKPRKILVCPECGCRLMYRKLDYTDHNVSVVSGKIAVTRRGKDEAPAPPPDDGDVYSWLVCTNCGEKLYASPKEFIEEFPHRVVEESEEGKKKHHVVVQFSELKTWSVKDAKHLKEE